MKTINLVVVLIFFCKISFGQCEIETKRVTVFKDATVFIEREGNCDINENKILLEIPYQGINNPQGSFNQRNPYVSNHIILGTLEIQSPDNKVLSTRSINVKEEVNINSIHQVFNANKGKQIKITLKGTKEEVIGNIYEVANAGVISLNKGAKQNALVLQNGPKWSFVNFSEIGDFEFIETPELTQEIEQKKLLLSFEKNRPNQNIKISYLQKGITWTPNYFINIKDEKNLELSLKANVVNDISELSNVELNLAVGIPVFKYSAIGDPLFSSQRVIDLLKNLNNLGEYSTPAMMSNAMTSQVTSGYVETYGNNVTPQMEGQGKSDIFLYKLDNVNLKKQERINLDILEMESKFENLFIANLSSNKSVVSSSKKEINKVDVWHALKFDNNTGVPLTTGAVFFKKTSSDKSTVMPISQGQLNFTPIGKHCIVKMSVSPNILIHDSDVEISREKHYKGYGDMVEVESEIEINNFKDEKIEMVVTKEIRSSELKESSEDWEIIRSTRSLSDYNQNNLVSWNIKVEGNSKKKIKYKYLVYIR